MAESLFADLLKQFHEVGSTTSILLLLVGILVIWWALRPRNLPPGPVGLPLVGYLPFLGREAYVHLHELRLKYGPIFSVYLGRRLVVVLGGYNVVKEALTNNKIMDRPVNPPNHLMPNSTSLSVTNGSTWKEQRHFTVQMLRKLGMGKTNMEEIINEEINHLLEKVSTYKADQAVDMSSLLLPSLSNNIVSLLTGKRLDYEHPDRQFLDQMLKTMTLYFRPTRIHAYFPWLRKYMAILHIWGYDKVETFMSRLGIFIEKHIEQHLSTLEKHNVRDYIDGYLLTMMNATSKSTPASFSKKMLKGNFQSLLGAGSTPARATLEWAIVAMVTYPEIQKRVQMELDSVVGRDRMPSWSDRLDLPYTAAVIAEVMRSNSIIPISMLRCTSVKTQIAGYDIPKGAIVMTNLWGVHHDPEFWTDPHSFNPDRFLVDSKIVRPEYYIPFSYGKRNCPGEDLANMEVFLYFTAILHRFSLSVPSDFQGFRHDLGIARLVFPDSICLQSRA